MLMCVEIACLLKLGPRYAWVRSAGSMGVDMYNAVTQRGCSVMWMELDCSSNVGAEEMNDIDVGGSDRCIRFPVRYVPSHHNLNIIHNMARFNEQKSSLYGVCSSSPLSSVMETLVLCGRVSQNTISEDDLDIDIETFTCGFPIRGGGGWGSSYEETTSYHYHLKFTYFQDLSHLAQDLTHAFRPATVEFDCRTCVSRLAPSLSNIHHNTSQRQRATTVNSRYFSKMPFLKKITLSPQLHQVAYIQSDFLSKCFLITEIDLSSLRNVTHIGEMFLAFCASLTCLDVSPLKNVVQVGKFFLTGCSSLKTLDLSPMERVLEKEELSIYACKSLIVVSAPRHLLHRVRVLGNDSCKMLAI